MLQINRNAKIPIYQQIYEQVKQDILIGNIPKGSRITSTRVLASELHVGRNSVENAYEQLKLEGYIKSIPGSGFIVNQLELNINQEFPKDQKQSNMPIHHSNISDTIKYSFQYGELDTDNFPRKLWRTYVADALDEPWVQSESALDNGKGNSQLRHQLKQYLYLSRGVKCSPDQIIICSGTQSALEIIARIVSREKIVAMEEPCYNGASTVFRNNGFEILPIPVNNKGIDLQSLSRLSVPMVHIAPSHQFPTGAVMPIQKRMEILKLSTERDMIIIEDDYDSEFRYKGRPIPSLQSIDLCARVIYIGTFSNVLSPGLRIAYIVLPNWLLETYHEKYRSYQCTVPSIEQKVLYRFMLDGHWEKHIRKVCLSQRKKHDLLLTAIQQNMGNRVRIHGHQAGMHIMLELPEEYQEDILIQSALDCGIQVCPVSPFWLDKTNYRGNAVLLGYGKIKEKDIKTAIELLSFAWFGR